MKKMTIELTSEQQKQIKDVTGNELTALSLDLGALSQKELGKVAGGMVTLVPVPPPIISSTDAHRVYRGTRMSFASSQEGN